MLVFDGGCPFCRHFAELSELRSGIPGLRIRDGRGDGALREALAQRGFHLRDGAMVIDGVRVWHGAAALHWLCSRMEPSAALLRVLAPLMADGPRSQRLYPLLLLARRLALGLKGLPVDPGAESPGPLPPPGQAAATAAPGRTPSIALPPSIKAGVRPGPPAAAPPAAWRSGCGDWPPAPPPEP